MIFLIFYSHAGPSIPPPILFFSNSSNSLCAESNGTIWSPIQGTHVLVDDITGGSILNRIFLEANICIDFNPLPKSCAPFHVNVTVFSQCVQSEPSSFQGEFILAKIFAINLNLILIL